jgi:TusA-related sulfurtransferase
VKTVLTDDKAMIEQMVLMAKSFGAVVNVEDLGNGQFRLTMSDEDIAKMPKVGE